MPFYQFRCAACGRTIEHFSPVSELEALESQAVCCDRRMDYDWTRSVQHRPFRAFVTKHVTGQPLKIDSLAELRRVERDYGVNFPAYGGSMMKVDADTDSGGYWVDDAGHQHRD